MDEAIQIQQRSMSRAGLLKLGAVAALVLGAGPAAKALESSSAAPAATEDRSRRRPRVRGPRYLRLATYVPLVGSTFKIHRRRGVAAVGEARRGDAAARARASRSRSIFRGHANAKLGQDTYNLEHPSLGTFPLFVVPVGPRDEGAGLPGDREPDPGLADAACLSQFLGQIIAVPFNFAPKGWAFCNGQTLPINQNQALFSLLGTTYGGNGIQTFQLPNLQSRVPMHSGQRPRPRRGRRHRGGDAHVRRRSRRTGTRCPSPRARTRRRRTVPTARTSPQGGAYAGSANASLGGTTTSSVGGSQAHTNLQPFLALNFVIALLGVFPSRN